ncbi:MAG TPA: IPT/TIG domain-containing protein [Pyrinomonadaceae bacterium]|nr:IPT/TIG domain-containing protein [Pyrinomonadaceae bacterium]
MALFEGKTPAERNKMIAAIALPLLAFIFVVRMLFFSSGPAPRTTNVNNNGGRASSGSRPPRVSEQAPEADILGSMRPVVYSPSVASDSGGGRNIFAFYERPIAPPPAPPAAADIPTPTPTPPPPQVLASLSPQSVFARTGGFTMQVSGDKFTPETRVYVDGQEQPTQYRSPQQLTATVAAHMLAAPGSRTVITRTPDNSLYSNTTVLSVMQPPAPTSAYVGLLKSARTDTAVLKDQRGELLSVRKGDLVEGGRFRVTEISERSVELVDKDLNIKHVLPFVETRATGGVGQRGPVPGAIQPPPPPPAQKGDEEGTAGEEEP